MRNAIRAGFTEMLQSIILGRVDRNIDELVSGYLGKIMGPSLFSKGREGIVRADGLDLAYIDYVVLDKDGNVCPVNDLKLSFSVKGSGTNAGVANANMLSDEPWQADSRTAYQGRAQLIIRSKAQPGTIKVTAKAKGMKAVVTEIVVK